MAIISGRNNCTYGTLDVFKQNVKRLFMFRWKPLTYHVSYINISTHLIFYNLISGGFFTKKNTKILTLSKNFPYFDIAKFVENLGAGLWEISHKLKWFWPYAMHFGRCLALSTYFATPWKYGLVKMRQMSLFDTSEPCRSSNFDFRLYRILY